MTEIDITPWLNPISDDQPTGVDLREDQGANDFRKVKDAREKARREEREAELKGEESLKAEAEWKVVWDKGLQILESQSKDLEVASYIIEAGIRLDSFAGLVFGLRLSRALIEVFWDGIYPRPDEGEEGFENTVLPLDRLLGSDVLGAPIRKLEITRGTTEKPLQVWQYRQASDLEKVTDQGERDNRIERGAVSLADFESSVRETNPEFFRETYYRIQEASQELDALEQILASVAGNAAPTFSKLKEVLEEPAGVVRTIAGQHLMTAATEEAGGSAGGPAGAAGPRAAGDGTINSREDALLSLLRIAEFFEHTEPQSVIPAQLRRIVRWGRMTPAQFFAESIKDDSVRDQFFELMGIVPPPSNND